MVSVSSLLKSLVMQVHNLKRHPLLLLSLVVAWLLYAFKSYLPALFPVRLLPTLEYYLRHTGGYDVLLVLWFAAVAYCAGKRILHFIGVSDAVGAEEVVLSSAAGIMFFSWLMLVLSLVKGLYRPVAYAALVVPTAIWHAEMRQFPRNLWRTMRSKLRSLSWSLSSCGYVFLAVYTLAALVVVLLSALGPSYEYDDLAYHLAGPKNFIQNHRLVPLPDVPLVFFPKNIEMLNTLAMLWHSDITTKLVTFLLGSCSLVAVYGFCKRFISPACGMIAVAVLASSPLFLWEMKTAHNDLGLTLFVFLGVYATVVWLRTRERSWLILACSFLAFSLGTKHWAILALGIVTFLVFGARLRQCRAVRPAISDALRLGLYSSVGFVPWGVVNLYYTGNPFFPLLNRIFQSRYWTVGHTNMAMGELFQGGIRITLANWWDLFRLPWEMMTDQAGRFGGNIGPWYVMCLPLLLLVSGASAEFWFVIAFGILYFSGWAVIGPWVRFVLPALPALAIGAAFAVLGLLRLLHSSCRMVAVALATSLATLAVLASPFFEQYGSSPRYGSAPIETLSINYLIGRESKNDFLNRFYPEYKAVRFLNQIPGDKKVFYVHTMPDGFYLNGKAAFHYSPYTPGLVGKSADYVHMVLRQNGITHVVVEQRNQHTSPLSSRESEFTRRYLRKLYQANAVIVYQLLPQAVEQNAVAYDFLDHLEKARFGLTRPGSRNPKREVRAVMNEARYVMSTEAPSEVEFFTTIPDYSILSFAAGRANPGYAGKASFQVYITPSGGDRLLVQNLSLQGENVGWIQSEVDLAKFAGQCVAITFKTEDLAGCCDYYWADPVLVSRIEDAYQPGKKPEPTPVVTGGAVAPDKVRIGQSFRVNFTGTGLNSKTYFDIRYLAPGSTSAEVAFNWQRGTSLRHTVIPSIQHGKWIITGVRAHGGVSDHQGGFTSLRVAVEVTR